MVMGAPYSYERVLAASTKYPHTTLEGKFFEWWVPYLRDEGFELMRCRFDGLHALGQDGGAVVGLLCMDIPHLQWAHIVAVDEFGVVDPADNAPAHVPLHNYVNMRSVDGVKFHEDWLAVRKA
jgi:hypothetical protein